MVRALAGVWLLCLGTLLLCAQEPIQRGKIKKVDAAKDVLTITTADGKDHDLAANDKTRFMGADGAPVTDGLKNQAFKEGAAVMFKIVTRNDKNFLVGVRLVGAELPKADTAKLKPLTEIGTEKYQ